MYTSTKKGDQQFTIDGRKAEIRIELVLQARAKMCDSKVNGPEDKVVSEMIKHFLLEKIYTKIEAPSSWKFVELVFLRKPDAEPKEGIRSYRAIALKRTRELEEITRGWNKWDKLLAIGSDGDKVAAKKGE